MRNVNEDERGVKAARCSTGSGRCPTGPVLRTLGPFPYPAAVKPNAPAEVSARHSPSRTTDYMSPSNERPRSDSRNPCCHRVTPRQQGRRIGGHYLDRTSDLCSVKAKQADRRPVLADDSKRREALAYWLQPDPTPRRYSARCGCMSLPCASDVHDSQPRSLRAKQDGRLFSPYLSPR